MAIKKTGKTPPQDARSASAPVVDPSISGAGTAALSNGRQEMFAQHLAAGKTATEAYAAAYGGTRTENTRNLASRLNAKPEVQARVAYYREAIAKDFAAEISYTRQDAMREADEAVEMARVQKSPTSMLMGVKLKAQLANILGDMPETAPKTLQEVDERLRRLLKKAEAKPKKGKADAGGADE